MRRSSSVSRLFVGVSLVAAVVVANPAGATPISGVVSLASGAVSLSSGGITGTTVPPTGIVAGYGGTVLNMGDLSFAAPVLANFVTFQAAPTLRVNLTGIDTGAYSSAFCGAAPAAGQTCSPGGALAGLSFINTPTGAIATITVEGRLDGLTSSTPVTGVYTFQFVDQTYQSVLAAVTAGGTLASTYSAEYTSADGATTFSTGGGLRLSATGIDFNTTSMLGSMAPGLAIIGDPASLSFLGMSGSPALISDISAAIPVNTPVSLMNFLAFAVNPLLSGELTTLMGGAFNSAQCVVPAAPGQTCSLVNSPYMFSNVAGGSVAAISLAGQFRSFPDVDPFQGLLSVQFAGMTYQQVLAMIAGGQSVTAMYSASFATDVDVPAPAAVPEPASLAFVGIGLVGLVLGRRLSVSRR